MPDESFIIDEPIALFTRDTLPEEWEALVEAESFGEAALLRRYEHRLVKSLGTIVSGGEQEALDIEVVEYVGKMFAIDLITPAISLFSKMVISQTAGERSTEMYKDRTADLKELRKTLLAETSDLYLVIGDLLHRRTRRATDAPRVQQAGFIEPHTTANPADMEPLYGEPEDVTGTT